MVSWSLASMLLTVGLVFLLALPFRPAGRGRDGWEDLGWLVVTALLAVAGAMVTGAARSASACTAAGTHGRS
jgi:hypothetical protein